MTRDPEKRKVGGSTPPCPQVCKTVCTYVEAGATRRSSTSFRATGVRLSELANIVYDPERPDRNVVDLVNRELRMYGEGRKDPHRLCASRCSRPRILMLCFGHEDDRIA
jgi:hypothetical protein